MVSNKLRKEFLEVVGRAYEHYGYPPYCGWIEGLLLLEPNEWTQKGISTRLSNLFSTSTSVPSVNRALKILESYGIVEKSGSRKIGFSYRLQSSSNLILSMFHQLLTINQEFITMLRAIETQNRQADSGLARAISTEISMAEVWNKAMEQIIASIQDKLGD